MRRGVELADVHDVGFVFEDSALRSESFSISASSLNPSGVN